MGIIIFIVWIVFAFLVAGEGKNRTLGFGAALAISLLLSPLIGLLFVAVSARKKHPSQIQKAQLQIDYNKAHKADYIGDKQEALKLYIASLYELNLLYKRQKTNAQKFRVRDKIHDVTALIKKLEADLNKQSDASTDN